MVTNSCTFEGSAAYPNIYFAGFAIEKIGKTSVSYRLGLFPMIDPELSVHVDLVHGHYADDPVVETRVEDKARVTGHSVHVLVDPITNKPVPFSEEWREKFTPASPRLSL